jgi:hypothetical protein
LEASLPQPLPSNQNFKKENKMKNVIFVAGLCLILSSPAFAGGEIKEVCKDKVDKAGKVVNGKDGKPVQECKKIKVHKKLEGTEVPPAKK